jgi:hypothetical protein
MEAHWRPLPGGFGFTCPNDATYPWQWLWDSCFHAVVWASLGDERSVIELATLFDAQDPETGFVPHIRYWVDPLRYADFWGRVGASSITQPPMYGHAARVIAERGFDLSPSVVESCRRGLWFLLRHRQRTSSGLLTLAHPWESGADDSPRWDDLARGPFDLDRWYRRKGELVASVERDGRGSPIGNADVAVASVAFNALVAFNAHELAELTADRRLAAAAAELAGAVAERWDPSRLTWVDDGPTAEGSGRARTLEGLLPALVDDTPGRLDAVWDALGDPAAHGAVHGPTGVHRAEPTFSPSTYWRGPAWPQLTYLLHVAARRSGRGDVAADLARRLRAGAMTSGFAEYWHPDTAEGLGAIPQSWATLAVAVSTDV